MSGVHYIGDLKVYVDDDGYVEFGVQVGYGGAKRVYPFKKQKTGDWSNCYRMVKLNTLRAGLRRGTYMFF